MTDDGDREAIRTAPKEVSCNGERDGNRRDGADAIGSAHGVKSANENDCSMIEWVAATVDELRLLRESGRIAGCGQTTVDDPSTCIPFSHMNYLVRGADEIANGVPTRENGRIKRRRRLAVRAPRGRCRIRRHRSVRSASRRSP